VSRQASSMPARLPNVRSALDARRLATCRRRPVHRSTPGRARRAPAADRGRRRIDERAIATEAASDRAIAACASLLSGFADNEAARNAPNVRRQGTVVARGSHQSFLNATSASTFKTRRAGT
jgi:hypothetical protein